MEDIPTSSSATTPQRRFPSVQCVHRGGAAVRSGNQALVWLPPPPSAAAASSTTSTPTPTEHQHHHCLAYASHGVVHVCCEGAVGDEDDVGTKTATVTLRRNDDDDDDENDTKDTHNDSRGGAIPITALASCSTAAVVVLGTSSDSSDHPTNSTRNDDGGCFLAVAYANGSIHLWERQKQQQWTEHVIVGGNTTNGDHHRRSITCLAITNANTASSCTTFTSTATNTAQEEQELHIVAGSSAGVAVYRCTRTLPMDDQSGAWQIQPWQPSGQHPHTNGAVASVRWVRPPSSTLLLLLVGTAAPRHNQIHVYYCNYSNYNSSSNHHRIVDGGGWNYAGGLTGHEDWITSLAMDVDHNANNSNPQQQQSTRMLLASGSQDARIRLWNFAYSNNTSNRSNDDDNPTRPVTADATTTPTNLDPNINNDYYVDSDDEDNGNDDSGESRLEIRAAAEDDDSLVTVTVTLEALLYGHEDAVTAVAWHPHPQTSPYAVEHLLLSSSLDRSIWLWSCSSNNTSHDSSGRQATASSGVWVPISRVGSAGGILGGPLGSSLLGFSNVTVEPGLGRTLVGHAYGGALHVWHMQCEDDPDPLGGNQKATTEITAGSPPDERDNSIGTLEERAARVRWIASPGATGHFDGVTDLAWETGTGAYLLTVSQDHTCRLWAPVEGDNVGSATSTNTTTERWVELARPQVHGYSLSAVTSVSTPLHPHRIVTGADEKELRAFDAPLSTLRLLTAVAGNSSDGIQILGDEHSSIQRVERAFIPSLGLSNKASATDAAEVDDNEKISDSIPNSTTASSVTDATSNAAAVTKYTMPLERDLGAISIWPETRKLFGHNTEIYCLTSTLAAQTCPDYRKARAAVVPNYFSDALVASSTKARTVEDAAIRLWDIDKGTCWQTLLGGHKSTVATLSFSPDGQFLASSGKDRRLCLWKRSLSADNQSFSLAWVKESAHKRIVWSVHFCPWNEKILASGSRDGCVKIWSIDDTDEGNLRVTEFFSFAPSFQRKSKPDAVTAVSFAPVAMDSHTALLALGLESGRIELWKIPLISHETTDSVVLTAPEMLPHAVDLSSCHVATITKLAWRPVLTYTVKKKITTPVKLYLASCSDDCNSRIFEVTLSKFEIDC